MTHDDLVRRGADWLRKNHHYRYRSQIVLTEFVTYADETPDVFGMSESHTNLIECKVSLADFKADMKKRCRGKVAHLGNWRMYLCPAGLIPIELVPADWGLLYCHDKKITIEKHPLDHNEPDVRAAEYHILYSIARRALIDGLLESLLRTAKQRGKNGSVSP